MTLQLADRIDAIEGVGSRLATRFADAFGIETVGDLLTHHPRRYHDAGEVLDLAQVVEGEPATLLGEVVDVEVRRLPARGKRRRLELTQVTVRQAGGETFRVTFFNQAWRGRQLTPATVAAFSGTVERFRGALQLTSPDVQVLGRVASGADPHSVAQRLEHQRLLAVYPAVDGLASFKIAEVVATALDALPPLDDWLDPGLIARERLVDLDSAVRGIHRPADLAAARRARRRLAFDELLALQVGLQWRRVQLEDGAVGLVNTPLPDGRAAGFLHGLPFAPTGAQRRAFDQIGADLAGTRPMHRLLQGDVGAGKTVVAVWAMLCAVDHGRQAALMVPTEVLAEQHHRTLTELLAPLGVNVLDGLRIEMLTASVSRTQRRRILGELLSGDVDIVVGTHALLEEGVRFADLGLVVVDEQHRFGVAQRVTLKDKAAAAAGTPTLPDVLVMTATPIPRSLALTVYGDLDVTVLDEQPPGRQPVRTELILPEASHRRERLHAFVRAEAAAGRRAYVVCPFVEQSQALEGTAVIERHAQLAREVWPDLEVELVHGRMRPDDKEAAMRRFRTGEAQVLVATTVIEVGVDVPEASIMIIEDAERFGISQLHQLRGRVGRGTARSYCVLFAGTSGELTDDARHRLEAVRDTLDGFALAEADLQIRGAGQLFGRRQSGATDLRVTRLPGDLDLVERTRAIAREVVAADPRLESPVHDDLRAEVARRFEGGVEAFEALETG